MTDKKLTFYELVFEKDASDMTEEEMLEAIADFEQKNEQNATAYKELKAEFDKLEMEVNARKKPLAGAIAEEDQLLSEEEFMEYSLERLEEMAESLPDGTDTPEFMREDKPSKAGDLSSYSDSPEGGFDIPGIEIKD